MSAIRIALAAALVASVLLFSLWPEIDLVVSGWFYEPWAGFWASDAVPVRWVYRGVTVVSRILIAGLLIALLASMWLWRGQRLAERRAQIAFALLAIALGPLLLVNAVLKDHWGRARPLQIEQFGGTRKFTPPLVPAAECARNCAFVSGHASAGFALIGIGLLTGPRWRHRWLWIGIAAGGLIGLARIAQGGHFASDIVFSFFVTLAGIGLAHWLARLFKWPLPSARR